MPLAPSSQCIIFDLDGTLVDSMPDLAPCVNRMLASRNLAPLAPSQVVRMVGDGAARLIERAFGFHGLHPDATALTDFLNDYQIHAADRSVPYPQVAETLQILLDSGYLMGVCTNKPERAARQVLRELNLARYFVALGGGDSFPTRKPDPAHLLATIKSAGGEVAHSVMVGDHHNDIEAARGAHVPAIWASWGYGLPEMAEGAAATADAFGEIPALVAKLRGSGVF